MACTQYGGFTYFSTNSGVSWSKVGSKTTFIKSLAMTYGTGSGKACLAGVSTYGSPYLMTHQNGQTTTEWISQSVGTSYSWSKGYYDVSLFSSLHVLFSLAPRRSNLSSPLASPPFSPPLPPHTTRR
jgi:hypothetical protein